MDDLKFEGDLGRCHVALDDVGAVVNADTDVIVDVDVVVGVYIFAAAVILQILHKVWSEVDPSPGRQQSHVALSRPSASASSTIKASVTSSLQTFRLNNICKNIS